MSTSGLAVLAWFVVKALSGTVVGFLAGTALGAIVGAVVGALCGALDRRWAESNWSLVAISCAGIGAMLSAEVFTLLGLVFGVEAMCRMEGMVPLAVIGVLLWAWIGFQALPNRHSQDLNNRPQ